MDPASANAKTMLQALGALDGSLATARAAVLTVQHELLPAWAEGEPGRSHSGPLKLSAAGWMGDEVLAYMAALSEAIGRYTMTLEVERAALPWRGQAA
jgi:hypothetical protein